MTIDRASGQFSAAIGSVALVEAANEREEALAVAVALRDAIDQPDQTAALITADRDLARRVSTELARFNIAADDSGGHALRETQPATLMRLTLETVFNPGDPVSLLALLKHPLTRLGLERSTVRQAAETIELVSLRGGTGRASLSGLAVLLRDTTGRRQQRAIRTRLGAANFRRADRGSADRLRCAQPQHGAARRLCRHGRAGANG